MGFEIELDVAAFAAGFAVFLAFVGGAVAAPPDPFSQLVSLLLFVPLVPVVYGVLVVVLADRHRSRRARWTPFGYLVVVSLAASGAALAVPVSPAWGARDVLLRSSVFFAVVLAVSVATRRLARDW